MSKKPNTTVCSEHLASSTQIQNTMLILICLFLSSLFLARKKGNKIPEKIISRFFKRTSGLTFLQIDTETCMNCYRAVAFWMLKVFKAVLKLSLYDISKPKPIFNKSRRVFLDSCR